MDKLGKSYYGKPGVREICHAVKQNEDAELKEYAVKVIADDLIGRGIVTENDILIPAPQHTGNAEYTREIAERIASVTGARVADILKCIPHISLYEQKETGAVPELNLYIAGTLPKGKSYFFVDNVISTGTTFRTANQLFCMKLKPLVYAVDETKHPDLGMGRESVLEKLKQIQSQNRMSPKKKNVDKER